MNFQILHSCQSYYCSSAQFGNWLLSCNMYRSRSKYILVVHVDSGLSPSQIARAIHESIREMHGRDFGDRVISVRSWNVNVLQTPKSWGFVIVLSTCSVFENWRWKNPLGCCWFSLLPLFREICCTICSFTFVVLCFLVLLWRSPNKNISYLFVHCFTCLKSCNYHLRNN